jgi:hypothetical protein
MANMTVKIEQAAVELAEARRRFKDAESKYNALLTQYAESTKGENTQKSNENGYSSAEKEKDSGSEFPSLSERVVTVIKSDPSKRWKLRDIHQTLPGVKVVNLRATIYRLVDSGKVKKAGYGKFKAPPELNN